MRQPPTPPVDGRIEAFVRLVVAEGAARYRDFAWRRTQDPYAVLVSEVMLQQTQATRVEPFFDEWLVQFPTLEALAAAPLEPVLRAWQGLGYNRRALALKRLAEEVVEAAPDGRAELPGEPEELLRLPGVGPATAAGVMAFAYNRHAAYLETNVRTVVLHELFADADGVPDREVLPVVRRAADTAARLDIDARTWNFALLDYGTHLKRSVPNPSRRSAHHGRQSRFEGSRRQARARLLRLVMASPGEDAETYTELLRSVGEAGSGADPAAALSDARDTVTLLEELVAEGFLRCDDGRFSVA